jgi:hypothetical protein
MDDAWVNMFVALISLLGAIIAALIPVFIKPKVVPSKKLTIIIISGLIGLLIGVAIGIPVAPFIAEYLGLSSTKVPLADMECQQLEKGATIDGQPVPLSDWQKDCAYARPRELWAKRVTLTTWGIIIEYAGTTIVKATIVPPHEPFIFPSHSSLFAGYQRREGAKAAYMTANPDAPKPILYKKQP